jgi:Protein of unknown function (DUF2889)
VALDPASLTSTIVVSRSSVIDTRKSFARPDGVEVGASTVRARVRQKVVAPASGGRTVEFSVAAELGSGDHLRAVEVTDTDGVDLVAARPTLDTLPGRRVASGFRAALAPLPDTADVRMLRRILFDLPVAVMVAGQPALLDHPGARTDPIIDLAGTDQCSGWRRGGEMLTTIDQLGGRLRMTLGPQVDATRASAPVAAGWGGDLPPVEALASRRARSLTVTAGHELSAVVRFRDSYADPDGVERALHEWTVTASLDSSTGRIVSIDADSGQLPWQECPAAGRSAATLRGVHPNEIERIVAGEFRGISTCTHLNDTLRSMAELPDLIAQLPA